MKKNYTVRVPEVHYSYVTIDAESPEQALKMVKDGDGIETQCDYAYTLDEDEQFDVKETEE